MQITLKYNEHVAQVLSGAFIRGHAPDVWLQEINDWQIPLEKLVCFIVAQNNNPANAAGLFVVFSKDQMPGLLQVRHPYTALGKKLFIPVHAELSPAISEQELQSLLIWDYQVFHPTIGFIGFEKSDRIDLAELLQYAAPRNIYWGYAQPGLPRWLPLRQIGVQQITAQEVFDSFKEHISNKPLTDIPTSNKEEVPAWLNNPIAGGLFKGLYSIANGLNSLIPEGLFSSKGGSEGGSESSGGTGNENRKPGFFNKMLNWMEQKMEDLEKQRDSELKRLSDMFDRDSDEALQYAIPLDSHYMGRGTTAQPSGQLGKRSTEFNLGRLGGGRAVDGWNVDNYYSDLRAKYLKAAQKAIEDKDFKKAAYIYAHLLGDFTTAADMLRRGKYFREAAVLYKEHLKNLSMAAVCYEEGGLLMEAIDIYTELNQHEKAGDLYRELGQDEPALYCYEKCVVAAVTNKDYLEQSRIIIDKIGDTPRAKKVLLNGWHDIKQPEACLVKYLDLEAANNKDQMHLVVKTFYADNQAANKEMAFLNVMDNVNKKYQTTELKNACQEIAYEIVSAQVSAGNPESLFALRNFVPRDQLLTPDLYRFMHAFKESPKQKPDPDRWKLMSGVSWKKVLIWRNQILIAGIKPSGLMLARMNWDGYVEYITWNVLIKSSFDLLPLADPENTNHIILHGYSSSLPEKRLPKNKYFQDELIVGHTGILQPTTIGVGMHGSDIVELSLENAGFMLRYYTIEGHVKASHLCTVNYGPIDPALLPTAPVELMWSDNKFYLAGGQLVLRITGQGIIDILYQQFPSIYRSAVHKEQNAVVEVAFAYDDIVIIHIDDTIQDNVVRGIVVTDMFFLPSGSLVLASRNEVQVLKDDDNDTSWKLKWKMETQNDIIAVFPGPNRDQLGILESNGRITLHKMP